MDISRRRWLEAAICCLANLCVGSLYSWSVLAGPLAARLNNINGLQGAAALDTGSLAIIFTCAHVMSSILSIFSGYYNDRYGPKWIVFGGGVLIACGNVLSGMAVNFTMLVITYGFIVGFGTGMVYSSVISTCVKFFPDKRGLIGGLSTAAYGFSSVIMPPIARALIEKVGISSTFLILGLVTGSIICIGALFLIKCPADYRPANWLPPASLHGAEKKDYVWRELLRTPIFYLMMALLGCGALQGLMLISQASAVAQEILGISVTAAANMVSVLALCNVMARIFCGFLSDKIGRLNILLLSLLAALCGLALLYFSAFSASYLMFTLGICLVGLCFGCFLGVFPGFTADRFGDKYNSVNYSIMFLGFSAASYLGPDIMHRVHLASGSYSQSFLFAGLFALIGLVLALVCRHMENKTKLIGAQP